MSSIGRVFLVSMLATLGVAPAGAQLLFGSKNELLDPEKAFRISARALDERDVEVEFRIADGYYMYRDRFSFATASGRQLAEDHRIRPQAWRQFHADMVCRDRRAL